MNNTFNSQQKSVILQITNYHDEHRIFTIRIKLNRFLGIGMVKIFLLLGFNKFHFLVSIRYMYHYNYLPSLWVLLE